MSLFNDYETVVLDWLFGNSAVTRPASFTLGVSSTEPADNGSNIQEPSTGDYARVSITNNTTNFPNAPVGGPKASGADFVFPVATSPGWGAEVGWWVLWDGTTPVMWGELSPHKTIAAGDILRIPLGAMLITAD